MNKEEYLTAVSSKVFNPAAKEMLHTELESHIDEKTEFFEEIGYDDASQEKAVESMGETDEVASQFGQIHNDFYNPVLDILVFVLWLALLGGLYFLLKEFVFKDIGLSSLLIASSCLSFAFASGYCAVSIFKNKLLPILFSFFGIAATGVFNYFVLLDLDKKMISSLSNLFDFIFKTDIPKLNNYADKSQVITAVSILCAVLAVVFVVSLIYNIKVKSLANTRTDNLMIHFFAKFSIIICIIAFVLSVAFSAKSYFDVNRLKNEYSDAYDFVISLTDNASTKEEIIDFIKESDYPLEEVKDKEGNLIGYSYVHNLVDVTIGFDEIQTYDEIKEKNIKEYESGLESIKERIAEYYGDDYLQSQAFRDYESDLKQTLSESVERFTNNEYYKQEYCVIWINPNLESFNESYDLISTSFLTVGESEEDLFRSTDVRNLSEEEQFKFFKDFKPCKLNITYNTNYIKSCNYNYSYVFGCKEYKHIEDFTVFKPDAATKAFYDEIYNIVDSVKGNDMNIDKAAKEFGLKKKEPKLSKEEYEDSLKYLGSYFDDIKDSYDELYNNDMEYYSDDFSLIFRNNSVTIYDKYNNIVDVKLIGDSPVKSNINGEPFKKVRLNYQFYDKIGYWYAEAEHVPYYTAKNEKFYFYIKTIEDKTGKVGNTKEYYFTDRKNKFYAVDSCFVDENGYFCVNTGNIKYDNDSKQYKSPDGKIYTKATETSWDMDGNILVQSDAYESTIFGN